MATLGGTEEVQYSWSELGIKHGHCLWNRYEESVSGVHSPSQNISYVKWICITNVEWCLGTKHSLKKLFKLVCGHKVSLSVFFSPRQVYPPRPHRDTPPSTTHGH